MKATGGRRGRLDREVERREKREAKLQRQRERLSTWCPQRRALLIF